MGGCGRLAGTAGVPSAPEIAGAFRTYVSCHQQTHTPRHSRPMDQPVDVDEHGSFGQSRFPKALDHQLRIF